MKKIILLGMLLFSTMATYATDYYVAANGDDATEDGTSIDTPYKTLAAARDVARVDDTIIVDGSDGALEPTAQFTFNKHLMIEGINNAVIDGADLPLGKSLFNMFANKTISIINLQIENCSSTDKGSVFTTGAVNANITIMGCTFKNNTSTKEGGALFFSFNADDNAFIKVKDCVFDGNTSDTEGGAVCIRGLINVEFDNCTFKNNKGTNGAGMYIESDKTIDLKNSTFEMNASQGQNTKGAGAYLHGMGAVNISNTVFDNNIAPLHGGGLYVEGELGFKAAIDSCTFESNSAQWSGALHLKSLGDVTIDNSVFEGNTANVHGGAGFLEGKGVVSLTKCLFKHNQAGETGNGGALFLYPLNAQNYLIENSTFYNNTAKKGGALYINAHPQNTGDMIPKVNLTNLTVVGNTNKNDESAALIAQGVYEVTVKLNNSIVTGNNSKDVARAHKASLTINNSVLNDVLNIEDVENYGEIAISKNNVLENETVVFTNEAALNAGTDKVLKYASNASPVLYGDAMYLENYEDQLGQSRAATGAVDTGAWESGGASLSLTPSGLSAADVLLYFNAQTSKTQVKVNGAENGTLAIYALSGKKVAEQTLRNGVGEIDAAHLPTGVYAARITTAGKQLSKLFVIR